MIDYLVTKLDKNISDDEASIENIHSFSKDIIILDYLITCKQLLSMIIKDG